MKVIFLDVDGVLNTKESGYGGFFDTGLSKDAITHNIVRWDQACVDRLVEVVKQTGAHIVLSTYWRLCFTVEEFFHFFALYTDHPMPIIDRTADLSESFAMAPRSLEIHEWLKAHPEVTSYVVIDDLTPREFRLDTRGDEAWTLLEPVYINTILDEGMTDEHRDRAIALLGV